MKNSIASVLLLLLLAVPVAGQSQNLQSYPFARYPAKNAYKGKPVPPKLTTPTQRRFRTVLRRGAQKGPNFAGHYTVIEWGCGSNCVVFAVVDAISGKVYDSNMPRLEDAYPCGLLYQQHSRLLIVEKSNTPNGACKPHLYRWEGSQFIPVQDSEIYTSPDGLFQFSYARFLALHPTSEASDANCQGDLVCVEWPLDYVYEGYDFGGAGFWVGIARERESMAETPRQIVSQQRCLKFEGFAGTPSATPSVINGVKFATLSGTGVAAGTTLSAHLSEKPTICLVVPAV